MVNSTIVGIIPGYKSCFWKLSPAIEQLLDRDRTVGPALMPEYLWVGDLRDQQIPIPLKWGAAICVGRTATPSFSGEKMVSCEKGFIIQKFLFFLPELMEEQICLYLGHTLRYLQLDLVQAHGGQLIKKTGCIFRSFCCCFFAQHIICSTGLGTRMRTLFQKPFTSYQTCLK